MYVDDLERAKDFFIKYFNVAADAGYLNKTTGFRSYFLTFEDGARLEIMNQSDLVLCDLRQNYHEDTGNGNSKDC